MSRLQQYLEASQKGSKVVFKNRKSCRIVLNKRDMKFEKDIVDKTNIMGFGHGESKNGYTYKFNNDFDWEQALKLLGVL